MKNLTEAEVNLFTTLGRQYPQFVDYLNAWKQEELERLPYAATASMDVLRGRVQTLNELSGFFKNRV